MTRYGLEVTKVELVPMEVRRLVNYYDTLALVKEAIESMCREMELEDKGEVDFWKKVQRQMRRFSATNRTPRVYIHKVNGGIERVVIKVWIEKEEYEEGLWK